MKRKRNRDTLIVTLAIILGVILSPLFAYLTLKLFLWLWIGGI